MCTYLNALRELCKTVHRIHWDSTTNELLEKLCRRWGERSARAVSTVISWSGPVTVTDGLQWVLWWIRPTGPRRANVEGWGCGECGVNVVRWVVSSSVERDRVRGGGGLSDPEVTSQRSRTFLVLSFSRASLAPSFVVCLNLKLCLLISMNQVDQITQS